MQTISTSRALKKTAALLLPLITLASTPLSAALYWDLNGDTAGAGVTPTAIFNATNSNWNTDSTGGTAPGIWVAGETAVFSAGTDATGPFTVTITGTHTAAGVVVEEGTVSLTGTGAVSLNTGSVTINSGATLSLDNQLRISGVAGSKLFLNGGTIQNVITGANGTFYDQDAEIVLGAGGGTLSYTTAGVLNILQTPSVISGSGSLTKAGAGILAIAGTGTYTGPTFVTDGELRIRTTANRLPVTTAVTVTTPGILNLNGINQQIGSLSGNGSIGLGNAVLTVGDATDTAFSGDIQNVRNAGGAAATGNGKLTKIGGGILTLTGNSNTYTGATTITAGTLMVNGSIAGTSVIDISGTLGGTGTVAPATLGNINLLANGKLSPGVGVGTLSAVLSGGGAFDISGGVTATDSDALIFGLDTPLLSDRVSISGGALAIGAGVLEFDDFLFSTFGGFAMGDYVLFDGTVPITGSLGPIVSGTLGGLDANLQLADGGNDVVLHVVPEPGSVALLFGGVALLTSRRRRRA
jgi:autotransporter-associated beta strand protein